jgi:hypothetical protein
MSKVRGKESAMTPTGTGGTPAELAAVEAVARDYFEGWFTGDAARMEAALHPTLVKRSLREDGTDVDRTQSAEEMIGLTRDGRGTRHGATERRFEIAIADVYGDIANVTVRSAIYREYLHLGCVDGRWMIIHAFWAPVGDET